MEASTQSSIRRGSAWSRNVSAASAIRSSAVAFVAWMLSSCGGDDAIAPALLAEHDRGVALMGRYEYAAAEEIFSRVSAQAPQWLDAQVNLAIATLNRQQEGDEQLALDILGAVLAEEPQQLRALYTSAILHLYLGDAETAAEGFRKVALADPQDAYAAYFLGQALTQQGDYDGAAEWLLKSAAMDPYLRSAYWAGSQALRRLGRNDEAAALLADYQRFDANPAARLAGFSYARMGPKASALASASEPVVAKAVPEGPLFAAPIDVAQTSGSAIATVDIDGDGSQDVVATAPAPVVFASRGEGFEAWPDHPLSSTGAAATPLFGDLNNDGRVDAVLCSPSSTEAWRQDASDGWQRMATLGQRPCAAGRVFDADHDGDLDVFTVGGEGSALYSNNRDGTFQQLPAFAEAAASAEANTGGGRQSLVADLDGDRDLDIVVLNSEPPHAIWENDRTWQYRPYSGLEDFQSTALVAAIVADADADGHREIYGTKADGELLRWLYDGVAWHAEQVAAGGVSAKELDVADFDGDGRLDLLRVHADGFHVIDPRSGATLAEQHVEGMASAIAATFDAARGPSVLAATATGIAVWPPGPGRHAFLSLAPSGRNEAGEMRSNASGIGTLMEVYTGGRWTVLDVLDAHSGPGQSVQPIGVGLGGHEQVDFVDLTWPDGVTQTELDLAAGERHAILETQRQLASCPVFFAWDGTEYRFVSDVLGGAALGYLTAPGVYAEPRPVESYLLTADALALRDGSYHVKLTEPMEENAYLDAARLTVYDLPPGWSMALDERFAVGGAAATGRPIYFRESQLPAQVTTADGADVTAFASGLDRRAVPPGPVDPRFIGLLAGEQTWTMTFMSPLPEENAVLIADAWIEFPYSQTVFAASQAGRRYAAPTLEARDGDGLWRVVAAEFGYPGGMPRTMALPLPRLPVGTTALRLSSNMEIYWDRLRVVREEPLQPMAQTLAPSVARAARTGFPKRTTGAQRLPHYDYGNRATYDDAKVPRGFYTAWGDALELVAEVDGALAIIGSGEEIHLEFPAPAEPPADATRYFAVRFHGWAKDMDLYTLNGDTVGPLPALPDADATLLARRERLHARYNVRFQAGH